MFGPVETVLVLAVVGVVILGWAAAAQTGSRSGAASGRLDCTRTVVRPCYDRQTGAGVVGWEPKGGKNAFAACSSSAAPNDQGELVLETAYCGQESVRYCYDGRSEVLIRAFAGTCATGLLQTRNEACPDYRPVPYHQVYAALAGDDRAADYGAAFASFLDAARNERVYRVLQSSRGALFALVSRYEFRDPYWAFVPYIYSSADKGGTWTAVALPATEWYEYVSAIAEDRGGNLYAAGRGPWLWKSADGGLSWDKLPVPTYDEYYRNLQPYAVRDLTALSDGSLVVNVEFAGQAPFNTYKSLDGGGTWTKLFALPTFSLVEADDGTLVVADYSGDVYTFSNSVLTKVLSTFWAGTEHPLLKARDGTLHFVTAEQARTTQSWRYLWGYPIVSYASADHGATWQRVGEVPDALSGGRLAEGADGSIYVGALSRCWGGTVYALDARARTWEVVSGSLPALSNLAGPLYTIFSVAEIDGKIVHAGNLGALFASP